MAAPSMRRGICERGTGWGLGENFLFVLFLSTSVLDVVWRDRHCGEVTELWATKGRTLCIWPRLMSSRRRRRGDPDGEPRRGPEAERRAKDMTAVLQRSGIGRPYCRTAVTRQGSGSPPKFLWPSDADWNSEIQMRNEGLSGAMKMSIEASTKVQNGDKGI